MRGIKIELAYLSSSFIMALNLKDWSLVKKLQEDLDKCEICLCTLSVNEKIIREVSKSFDEITSVFVLLKQLVEARANYFNSNGCNLMYKYNRVETLLNLQKKLSEAQ